MFAEGNLTGVVKAVVSKLCHIFFPPESSNSERDYYSIHWPFTIRLIRNPDKNLPTMNEGCVRAKSTFSIKNKTPTDLKSSARQENGATHPLGLPARGV